MKLPFLSVSALTLGALILPAAAQPDLNQAPKADNPANRARNPQRDLTAQQRAEIFEDPAKLREWNRRNLRAQLERVNVRDAPSQEALLLFVENEVNARDDLMEKARELQRALRGDTLTETQFAGQFNLYQVALEDDRERRDVALATLKKTVDVSRNPRLEAMLTLMGVYGNGPSMGGSGWISLGRGAREMRPRVRPERGGAQENNNPFGLRIPPPAPNAAAK